MKCVFPDAAVAIFFSVVLRNAAAEHIIQYVANDWVQMLFLFSFDIFDVMFVQLCSLQFLSGGGSSF